MENHGPPNKDGIGSAVREAGAKRAPRVQPPVLTNQQLVAATNHPTRVHAVAILGDRVASAAEIGREIGRSARHVSYHLKQLEKLGVIELVRVEETAGGRSTGRFYRARVRPWYDSESWKQIDDEHQPSVTSRVLASCNGDLAAAVKAGTIHRPDNHISRTTLLLDKSSYRQLVDRLGDLLSEVVELQQHSAAHMKRGDETVLAKVHIIQFPTPDTGSHAAARVMPTPGSPSPELSENDILSLYEHPTRLHALGVLCVRAASASELGRELGRSSDHVAYHLKRLRKAGLIEVVEVQRTSGGRMTGKYYQALARPWFDTETWEAVDPRRQATVTSTLLGLCNADIAEAVQAGTINEPDSHMSRTPMVVDRDSYRELIEVLDVAVTEILELQDQATPRLNEGAERITTKVHLFQFESPDPEVAKEAPEE